MTIFGPVYHGEDDFLMQILKLLSLYLSVAQKTKILFIRGKENTVPLICQTCSFQKITETIMKACALVNLRIK